MATIKIIARCDQCEEERTFDCEEDFWDSEWWTVSQGDMELLYCDRECLITHLTIEDAPFA